MRDHGGGEGIDSKTKWQKVNKYGSQESNKRYKEKEQGTAGGCKAVDPHAIKISTNKHSGRKRKAINYTVV